MLTKVYEIPLMKLDSYSIVGGAFRSPFPGGLSSACVAKEEKTLELKLPNNAHIISIQIIVDKKYERVPMQESNLLECGKTTLCGVDITDKNSFFINLKDPSFFEFKNGVNLKLIGIHQAVRRSNIFSNTQRQLIKKMHNYCTITGKVIVTYERIRCIKVGTPQGIRTMSQMFVGVDNKIRKVRQIFVGVNGKPKEIWKRE